MIQNTKILQLYKSSEQLFQIGDLQLSIVVIIITATIVMTLILVNVIIKLIIIVITSTIVGKSID